MSAYRPIMAIGAHADDVEIYFGGTLFKYIEQGYEAVYMQSTNNMSGSVRTPDANGSIKHVANHPPVETMRIRKSECDDAAALFNTKPIHLDHPQRHYRDEAGRKRELRYGCELPEGVRPDVPSILTAAEESACVDHLAKLILEHDPEVIFTHGFVERNPEHYATARLTIYAFWQAVESGYAGSLLHAVNRFAELGAFNGTWETFVDISGYVDRRMAAIQKHVSQYPPAFSHGAAYWREFLEKRGEACGVEAAEAFNFVHAAEPSETEGPLIRELREHRAKPNTCYGPASMAAG